MNVNVTLLSCFGVTFEKRNIYNQILWNTVNCPIQDVQVDFKDYMNSESGLWSALRNIWTHGFCIVKNTPLSIEKGTKPLAQRIGPRFQGIIE